MTVDVVTAGNEEGEMESSYYWGLYPYSEDARYNMDNGTIGFLIAAILMIALLAVLSYLRDTIRSEGDIEEKLDTIMLASIPHETKYHTLKEKIRRAIHALNRTYGTTVVLTTHDMTDIEDLCSRIILLEKGKILYDGALKSLKNRFGNLKTLTLTVPAEIRAETAPPLSPELTLSEEEGRLVLRFDADRLALEEVIQYAFRELRAMDMKLAEISVGDVVKTILSQQEAAHAEKI